MGWPNVTPSNWREELGDEPEIMVLLTRIRKEVLEDPRIARARQASEDRAKRRAGRKGKSKDNPFKDVSYPHGDMPGTPPEAGI